MAMRVADQSKPIVRDALPRQVAVTPSCRAAYATHPGKRAHQEDALYVDGLEVLPSLQNGANCGALSLAAEFECSLPCVFAIADGMGGQNAGDIASEACIRRIADGCTSLPASISLREAMDNMQSLVRSINQQISDMASSRASLRNMGSTLVALIVCADGCAVLSIGDSRAYSYRNGSLSLVTKDDTEGQRLLDLALVSADELGGIADRDRLTRFVGMGQPGLIVRASEYTLQNYEKTLLLCSDGVSKELPPHEMESILGSDMGLLNQAKALVNEATGHVGSDNASAILVRIG